MCEGEKTLEDYEREFVDNLVDKLVGKLRETFERYPLEEVGADDLDGFVISIQPTLDQKNNFFWRWKVSAGETEVCRGMVSEAERASWGIRFPAKIAAMLLKERQAGVQDEPDAD